MIDIVEQARDMHASAADSCDPAYNRILLEMAAEIERLRREAERLQASNAEFREVNRELRAEIERLRTLLRAETGNTP